MDDAPPPHFPFPAELARALADLALAIRAGNVHVVDRRVNRRLLLHARSDGASIVALLGTLTSADFHDGPLEDHHASHRTVWVFGPHRDGRQLYVKFAITPGIAGGPPHLHLWSLHVARHPLALPFGQP